MTNTQYHLLVVDDDKLIFESVKLTLPPQWKMIAVSNPDHINNQFLYHAALVDMHLSNQKQKPEGPKIIEGLMNHHPQLEIIAMSGDHSRELMEKCLKVGATRFLNKPIVADELKYLLEKIEALWALKSFNKNSQINWVGTGKASQTIKQQIAQFKSEHGTLLIEGETGTGKEVTARLLNEQEKNRPFVSVNVAAIPENLFESELFGHIKGAFTGADQNKVGLAEAAHGGDLFLDEIEALPLHLQVKLLRFLETGEVRKVGSQNSFLVNVRTIFATNQKLEDLVAQGKFRQDLLFRISSKKIQLPALRERKEDIQTLAQFFIDNERPRRNKTLTDDAIELLKTYTWPGNIRELKRIIEQVCLTSPLPIMRAEDFKPYLQPKSSGALKLDYSLGLGQLVAQFEKQICLDCLQENENNIDKAIKVLQISRASFYNKIKDDKEV